MSYQPSAKPIKTLTEMIEWPPGSEKKPEPDMRFLRCALDGYIECAAKISAACICNQMPRPVLLKKMRKKYGPDWPS